MFSPENEGECRFFGIQGPFARLTDGICASSLQPMMCCSDPSSYGLSHLFLSFLTALWCPSIRAKVLSNWNAAQRIGKARFRGLSY